MKKTTSNGSCLRGIAGNSIYYLAASYRLARSSFLRNCTLFHLLFLTILISFPFSLFAVSANTSIGLDALIELPKSAEWISVVNFRPSDGDLVKLNPPRFSWCYTPDPTNSHLDIEEKEFIFQVSYDESFTNPAVNLRTRSNMYNLLAPFSSNVCYWRIGYVHDGQVDPYSWSSTRRFIIADDAALWDRSMLANTNYLSSKGQHPYMLFNVTNRLALFNYFEEMQKRFNLNTKDFIEIDVGKGWMYAKDQAAKVITNSWWPDQKPTNLWGGDWASQISNLAFVWQITRDPIYTNAQPQKALLTLTRYYVANNGPLTDSIYRQEFIPMLRTISFCYDWFYEIMSTEERREVLNAIEIRCRYITRGLNWWAESKDPRYSWSRGDPSGQYTNGCYVRLTSHAKRGDSHGIDNFHYTMPAALASFNDSVYSKELLDLGLNYMIGKTYCYGEGAMNQGRSYGDVHMFNDKMLLVHIFCNILFPEAQFNKNPFWMEAADWWSRMLPVGFTQGHEPWGDGGCGELSIWQANSCGRNISLFLNDPKSYLHWQNEVNTYSKVHYRPPDSCDLLTVPFYYKPPNQFETNTITSKVFKDDGWVIGSTFPSNTKECFYDGVGFIFQARPRGSECGHSHFSDLSFQIWAYGVPVTDAGAQMSTYAKVPISHYTLLVDGLGPCQPNSGPNEPFYSKVIAFKDTSNYTYVAADATYAYPRKKFYADGWLLRTNFTFLYNNAPLAHLQKVQRHILFHRKKYFVMYDDFSTTKPSTFQWLYHVPWHYKYNTNISKFPGQTVYATDVRNFDSLMQGGFSFFYTNSNVFPGTPAPESVLSSAVYVSHIVNSNTMKVFNMDGTNVRSNPITGENYFNYGDEYTRSHAIWISSKNPATNFHFLSVIYPIRQGSDIPVITRLDDYTVEVNNGTEHDVISFNPNTKFPATLTINSPHITIPTSIRGTPINPSNLRTLTQ